MKYWYPLAVPSYGEEEVSAAVEVLRSGQTTMGPRAREFEEAFARWHDPGGQSASVMVNSGSSADLVASMALATLARKGSTVLIPAVTWPTHVWSAIMAGFRVRLVDVEPSTLNVSRATLEKAWTNDVSAVSVVHLLGNPCPMDEIVSFCEARKLVLLEDCCEALGATWRERFVGTFGTVGTFSFFFAHHMTTMEGGIAMSASPDVLDAMRLARAHGWTRAIPDHEPPEGIDARYCFTSIGLNVRPTEIQAAFGLCQLKRLQTRNDARRRIARTIMTELGDAAYIMPQVAPEADPCWMALPFIGRTRAGRLDVQAKLEALGVETRPIVAGNLARQPVSSKVDGLSWGEMPGADLVHENGFYVGLNPDVSEAGLERLTETLKQVLI
jgi:CDP-6-deoxy-D-xylo-4-hexulose-3-dehydrase